MTKETPLMRRLQVAATAGDDIRLFRNNVGMAYQGKVTHWNDGPLRGPVVLQARPIKFGLCEGSGDLIGWRTITITPDMVGRSVAVFTSLEIKTATGTAREQQERFSQVVRSAGGIGEFVRNESELAEALKWPRGQ